MAPQEFQSFADNYSSEDFNRISFQWEGGYGANFKDKNYEFRMQLCEFLISQLPQIKLELIKDLYLEIGKTSDYTFGCYMRFHLLAQELLERGGSSYMTTYLQGATHNMDTFLSSGRIQISKERAKELLAYFDSKMKNPADAEEKKLYCDQFRTRFEWHANK